jgi:hypothetical protein
MAAAPDAPAQVLSIARSDSNVVGFYVGGSRAKGAETALSDHDCCLIVNDAVAVEYKARYTDWQGLDLWVCGLTEFERHAAIGSATEWDRYNFAHLTVAVDKLGGEIQRLVDEKGCLPEGAARQWLGALDGYINAAFRSLKNHRDGRGLAARLDAAESIPPLLTFVFALHRRLRPYNKYLRWELETWPLAELPWSASEFLSLLERVVAGDVAAQREVFAGVRPMAMAAGLQASLTVWGDSLAIFQDR